MCQTNPPASRFRGYFQYEVMKDRQRMLFCLTLKFAQENGVTLYVTSFAGKVHCVKQ